MRRRATRKAPYRGNYFYRDGQKLPLVKTPDAFALRLKEGRLPAQVGAWAHEPLAPVALERTYGAKRLASYRVRTPDRDRTMDALRRDPRTQYCTHVYHRKGARIGEPLVLTDEIVVQFPKGRSHAALRRLCRGRGIELGAPVPGLPNGYLCRVTAAAGENALKVANRLVEEAHALAAEPNFLRRMARRAFVPDDPVFARQWHLENLGRNGAKRGADVRALETWTLTRGSRRIAIAVIDDGFDLGHPDLGGRGKVVAPYDVGEDDPDPSPSLRDAHGTACAGVATAVGGDGVGVTGIAPGCRLMPIRLPLDGLDEAAIERAFRWAVDRGADVISCSWGPPDGTGVREPIPLVVRAALDRAAETGRKGRGCVICFAAGNGDEPVELDGYASYPWRRPPTRIAAPGTATTGRPSASPRPRAAAGTGSGLPTCGAPGLQPQGRLDRRLRRHLGGLSPRGRGRGPGPLREPAAHRDGGAGDPRGHGEQGGPGGGRYDARGWSRYYGYGRVDAARAVREAGRLRKSSGRRG